MRLALALLAFLVALTPASAAARAPLVVFQSSATGSFDIWTVGLDGSGARDLTETKAYDSDPSWSPDGRRIVFSSYRSGRAQVWVMKADGSGLRRLTHDHAYDVEPAWSPDGTRIAFVRSPDSRRDYRIWVMRADGTGARLLSHAYDWQPSWSPNSRRLVFTSARTGYPSLYVMNADGSGQRRLRGEVGIDNSDPSWSPDGRLIAWMHSAQLWVMNADGSAPRALTPSPTSGIYDERPHWSPDSSRIVFETERVPSGLAIIGADGSNMTGIPNVSHGAEPAWQP